MTDDGPEAFLYLAIALTLFGFGIIAFGLWRVIG